MATLIATVGSTSISLSDKNPYMFLRASGMGGADIRRITAQGPAQHGNTDLGYRLGPREIELVIGYRGTTDALVDGYRDTLASLFKPLSSTPVNLKLTRDDGGIRQVDVYAVGDIGIDLAKERRPGHYQEATIRLRAADPAFYDPTPGTATVTGTAGIAANWWLAGGAIGTAQVLMSGGTPSQNETWTYAGTIGTATGFTIAVRTSAETITVGSSGYVWGVTNDSLPAIISGPQDLYFGVNTYGVYEINGRTLGTDAMPAGTSNYLYTYDPLDPLGIGANGFERSATYGPLALEAITSWWDGAMQISGTARKWRTNVSIAAAFTPSIPLYALYSPALSVQQRTVLNVYMQGAIGGTISQVLAVPYGGDLPEFPTIRITGPITSPSVVNSANGYTISFPGITIAGGATYVIDTRPNYKTVLSGATNKRSEVASSSDLGNWRLEPAPVAAGGTNMVAVTGTGASSATSIQVIYYNRYVSH